MCVEGRQVRKELVIKLTMSLKGQEAVPSNLWPSQGLVRNNNITRSYMMDQDMFGCPQVDCWNL